MLSKKKNLKLYVKYHYSHHSSDLYLIEKRCINGRTQVLTEDYVEVGKNRVLLFCWGQLKPALSSSNSLLRYDAH